MAQDAYLTDNPEALDISRQRKLADLLTGEMFNQPQGQMISGHYVAPSWTQQLAPLAKGIAGQAMNANLDTKQLKLAEALRIKKDEIQQQIMEKIDAGDTKGALAIASKYPEYGGKEFVAPLLANVIPKAAEPTVLEREYKAAIADPISPYKGSITQFKNQLTEKEKADIALRQQEVGLSGARLGIEQQKLAFEQSGGKPLTESQGNATAFGIRMKESNQLLNNLEEKGVKDTGIVRAAIAGTAGMTPFIGQNLQQGVNAAMNVLPGALGGPSAEQQQVDAARRNFVTAVLRKESGAAISPSEFYNESQKYFPQPGDSSAVVAQKRHARDTAIKAMEIQAGPGKRQIEQMSAPKSTGQVKFLGFE